MSRENKRLSEERSIPFLRSVAIFDFYIQLSTDYDLLGTRNFLSSSQSLLRRSDLGMDQALLFRGQYLLNTDLIDQMLST